MSASVNGIVGMDLAFYELMPRLYPQADSRSWFVAKAEFELTKMQGAVGAFIDAIDLRPSFDPSTIRGLVWWACCSHVAFNVAR